MTGVNVDAPAPMYAAAAPQQQMIAVQLPTASYGGTGCCSATHYKAIRAMGVVQVACGACSAVLGFVLLFSPSLGSISGFPIWGGIGLYLVAGILGIVAASKKSKRLVLAFMVMSIIAAVAAGAAVILHSLSAAIGPLYYYRGYYNGITTACDLTITMIALVELIIAIIGASMTCGALRKEQCVVQYQAAPMQVGGMTYQPQSMYTQQVAQPQYTAGPLQGVQGAQQAGAFGASPPPAQHPAGGEGKLPVDPPQYQSPY